MKSRGFGLIQVIVLLVLIAAGIILIKQCHIRKMCETKVSGLGELTGDLKNGIRHINQQAAPENVESKFDN